MLCGSRSSPSLARPLAPSPPVNVQVCGFVEWHSVFQVKLVAQLLTWLVNGCYLWEGGVDSANIAHSLHPPPPALLMVMAVMTEETKRRRGSENTEMETF